VFTVKGKYTTRGWTEWTQGFQFGFGVAEVDAPATSVSLKSGGATRRAQAAHVVHIGVHDHGFNNISLMAICFV